MNTIFPYKRTVPALDLSVNSRMEVFSAIHAQTPKVTSNCADSIVYTFRRNASRICRSSGRAVATGIPPSCPSSGMTCAVGSLKRPHTCWCDSPWVPVVVVVMEYPPPLSFFLSFTEGWSLSAASSSARNPDAANSGVFSSTHVPWATGSPSRSSLMRVGVVIAVLRTGWLKSSCSCWYLVPEWFAVGANSKLFHFSTFLFSLLCMSVSSSSGLHCAFDCRSRKSESTEYY